MVLGLVDYILICKCKLGLPPGLKQQWTTCFLVSTMQKH